MSKNYFKGILFKANHGMLHEDKKIWELHSRLCLINNGIFWKILDFCQNLLATTIWQK